MYAQPIQYAPTMVQAINNPDGTVSIIGIDPNSHGLVTLSDGTQAQVRTLSAVRVSMQSCAFCSQTDALSQIQGSGDASQAVQTLADMSGQDDRVTQLGTVNVDLGGGEGTQVATLAEATIGPDGQIILTGEDGTQSSEFSCALFRVSQLLLSLLSLPCVRYGDHTSVHVSDGGHQHPEHE